MSTWTELLGRATPDSPRDVDVSPAELRELLLDLPHHPHAGAVRSITVEVNAGMAVRLRLPLDESMTSGSSGTMETGAAVRTRASAPLVYAPARDDEHGHDALLDALRTGADARAILGPLAPVWARDVATVAPASDAGLGADWLAGIEYDRKP